MCRAACKAKAGGSGRSLRLEEGGGIMRAAVAGEGQPVAFAVAGEGQPVAFGLPAATGGVSVLLLQQLTTCVSSVCKPVRMW